MRILLVPLLAVQVSVRPLGFKLSKPFTDLAEAKKHKKLECLESGERGEIEKYFSVRKRRYLQDCIVV